MATTRPIRDPRYEDWLHLRLALLSCYRGRPGSLEARFVPTGMTAWLIYRGRATVTIGQEVAQASPGQWLIPRPVPRLHRFTPDIELLSLNFYAQWPTGEPLFSKGLSATLNAADHPELEADALGINQLLEHLVPQHDYTVFAQPMSLPNYLQVQQAFPRFFASLVHALEARGVRPSSPAEMDPRLADALARLQTLPMARPLDLPSIARSGGLSPVQLNRLAVQQLGHTLREHRERQRSEYARRALLAPGTAVKQVALALGFDDLGRFSRWFRRLHGVSPREFRGQRL